MRPGRDGGGARWRFCGAWLAAALLLTPVARAETAADYPSRPVTVTVCFPPGASTDAIARRVGERLAASLGRPVVTENRGGAGGNIAASYIAKAPPDGHSLLFCATSGLVIAAAARRALDFDPQRDLAPVAPVGALTVLLITRPSLPVTSVQELLAHARANPGRVNFASIGVGSSFHLALEQINAKAGVAMTHIPFRGGGQAVPELLAGRLDAMFASWSLAQTHVQAGSVRPLAVAGEARFDTLPEVPTLAEAGLPGIWLQEGLGFFVPAGTPQPIIARLNAEITRIITEPAMRDWLLSQGVPPTPEPPEAFQARLQEGVTVLREVIQRLDLKLD
ncbi:Bug family tripartite tricarboxylate transporter substrate binding protein [Roseicella aerolata]|uniref:Tripartite tricarboxylate transporter substrate binding protein n=1 Tax=Roseicella aerolata TaxID=2883479 RepID=A0A9X1IKM3_9PROT|nr:tripartite tricarboxylate transporter substrate-binding protein [Roseicella aerolata]MCB4825363.1 tripartite tricarboxylate transporter substrate binding protein [Roseicella aerolata]